MRLRSLLFAPGDSERKIARALASGADGVILDLEDSVSPGAKAGARALVARLAPPGAVIRVNPRGTPWYLDDLAAVVATRPAAIMLPKCGGAADLVALDHHVEALEAAAGLPVGGILALPIVTESASAVAGLPTYPRAPRVLALCFGAEDLSADLGISPRRPDMTYPAPVAAARAAVLIAAAAAGVPAIDTPWPDPRDDPGLRAEAALAASDGFAGKLCIHPGQIAAANEIFTPAPAQIEWARRVLDAFAAHPEAGVLAMDGKMLDRPHLRLAARIVAASGS